MAPPLLDAKKYPGKLKMSGNDYYLSVPAKNCYRWKKQKKTEAQKSAVLRNLKTLRTFVDIEKGNNLVRYVFTGYPLGSNLDYSKHPMRYEQLASIVVGAKPRDVTIQLEPGSRYFKEVKGKTKGKITLMDVYATLCSMYGSAFRDIVIVKMAYYQNSKTQSVFVLQKVKKAKNTLN